MLRILTVSRHTCEMDVSQKTPLIFSAGSNGCTGPRYHGYSDTLAAVLTLLVSVLSDMTHQVGKWDAGMATWRHTPRGQRTRRGLWDRSRAQRAAKRRRATSRQRRATLGGATTQRRGVADGAWRSRRVKSITEGRRRYAGRASSSTRGAATRFVRSCTGTTRTISSTA